MPSQYTPSLKLQEIANGEQSGIWGATTNNNLTLIEQAITGVITINMNNQNYTLSNLNGVPSDARNAVIVATGTNSAIRQIIAPLAQKFYVVSNRTTGGFDITIGGSTGALVAIKNGVTAQVYCDGADFYSAQTGSAGNFAVDGDLTVDGNLTAETSNATTFNGTTANVATVNATTLSGTTANVATVNATTFKTANFTITEVGGLLQIKYGANVVMSINSTGSLISATNITAYGTP